LNPFDSKIYAGIGMRDQYPAKVRMDVEQVMYESAYAFAFMGYKCRSGRAENSDKRFEQGTLDAIRDGATGSLESFLPSSYFNGMRADGKQYFDATKLPPEVLAKQRELVERFHPKGTQLKGFTYNAMARNGNQVLGPDMLSPSRFILCAAKNSKFDKNGEIYDCKGGTGQAVRVAYHYKIPVFNLLHPPHLERMWQFILNKHPKYQEKGPENNL
tara:strand:+ start:2009 stop:2653 length:645 start_codon:yes stop_codon:yes gene_type:complete